MRILTILIFAIVFSMCNSHKNEIIGKWKFTRTLINGKKDITGLYASDSMEIEFLQNGEQLYFSRGKPYGIGKYKYKVAGDSILWTNESIDGKVWDTVWLKFSVDNNTLTVRGDSLWYYLERSD